MEEESFVITSPQKQNHRSLIPELNKLLTMLARQQIVLSLSAASLVSRVALFIAW